MKGRKEISLSHHFVGDGFMAVAEEKTEKTMTIFADSESTKCSCPMCGVETDHCVGTYKRKLQDIPRDGKRVDLVLNVRKYFCHNEECQCGTFSEPVSLAGRSAVRTDNFDILILAISTYASAEGTSRIIRELGGSVSNNTVERIQERVIFPDDSDEEEVGVDDFSVDKGQKYATGIYSAKDHHVIAILEGRDGKSLRQFLLDNPQIKRIARDRASAYAKVISEVLPECEQCADRFHLYQNLTDRLYEVFKEDLPSKFFIRNGTLLNEEPERITVPKISPDDSRLKNLNYDNSPVIGEDGKAVEITPSLDTCSGSSTSLQNKIQKLERIEKIQGDLAENGKINFSECARTLKISVATAKSYALLPETTVEKLRNQIEAGQAELLEKLNRNPATFNPLIYNAMSDRVEPEMIFALCRNAGYSGTTAGLERQICDVGKEMFGLQFHTGFSTKQVYPPDIYCVKRFDLLKFMTISDKSRMERSNVAKYYATISANYPVIATAEGIYKEFDKLVKDKSKEELDAFIARHSVEGDRVSGFAKGLESDYQAVLNGITTEMSSGFVEGNNNKVKWVERTMYGRYEIVYLELRVKLSSAICHGQSTRVLYRRSQGHAYGPRKKAAA